MRRALLLLLILPMFKAATMTLVYTVTVSAPNYIGTLTANYTIYVTIAHLFSTTKTAVVTMFNPLVFSDTITRQMPDVLLPFAIDVDISADGYVYYVANGQTTTVATLTNATVATQIVPGMTNTLSINGTFVGVSPYTSEVGNLSIKLILYIGKLPLYLAPLLGAAIVAYVLRRK